MPVLNRSNLDNKKKLQGFAYILKYKQINNVLTIGETNIKTSRKDEEEDNIQNTKIHPEGLRRQPEEQQQPESKNLEKYSKDTIC